MRAMGVLDGQIVQLELQLDLAEDVLVRLVQADLDEALLLPEGVLEVPDVDVGGSVAVGVDRAVDDARAHCHPSPDRLTRRILGPAATDVQ